MGVSALGSALQQTLQHHPAAFAGQAGALPPQTAQMLAGIIASEVVPMVKAELARALGPWLAESNAALKRLDTRLAVSSKGLAGSGIDLQQLCNGGFRQALLVLILHYHCWT